MRLLDLFCCAGGAATGYHHAGFDEIVGVDIEPQKHYPFTFVLGDALDYVAKHGKKFDVIHASPPCQGYSKTKSLVAKNHPMLIEKTREVLQAVGKPYIIENVVGAPLIEPIMLCGTMFGLKVIRHRLFECSPRIWFPPAMCAHAGKATGLKRTANSIKTPSLNDGYSYVTVVGNSYLADEGRKAMGINWMPKKKLSQAIPPAYTEWLGKEMINLL